MERDVEKQIRGRGRIGWIGALLLTGAIGLSGTGHAADLIGEEALDGSDVTGVVVVVDDDVDGNVLGGLTDGNANNNSVTVSDGYEVDGIVRGGEAGGTATGNTVTIDGDAYVDGTIMGGWSKAGSAGNSVVVDDAYVGGTVYGGYVNTDFSGDATGNTVTLENGADVGAVYGGRAAGEGSAADNSIIIDGAYAYGTVYGGYGADGGTNGNSVSLKNGAEVDGNLYGGYIATTGVGEAAGNTVLLESGSYVDGNVYGGRGAGATGNSVAVDGSDVSGQVIGGYANTGSAISNKVTLKNDVETGNVFGGLAFVGNVTNNEVTLTNGVVVENDVIGGYIDESGDATGNSVVIDGAEVGWYVYGGQTNSGNATGNTVSLSDTKVVNGAVNGGQASNGGYATDNSVVIDNGSEVGDTVFGGMSVTDGGAVKNQVIIKDAVIGDGVYGGFASGGVATGNSVVLGNGADVTGPVSGGYTQSGTVADNRVTLEDGAAVSGDVSGGEGGAGATGNKVAIGAAAVDGTVYGGYSRYGSADGNSVTLGDGADVTDYVYGGYGVEGDAIGNSVAIGAAAVGSTVYGGRSRDGSANSNSVTLGDGSTAANYVYGGNASASGGDANGNTVLLQSGATASRSVYSGYSSNGNASGNRVILEDGSEVAGSGSVTGGDAALDAIGNMVVVGAAEVAGGVTAGSADGSATGNSVLLQNGSKVGGDVQGGYADGTASDNSIILEDGAEVTGNLYAAYSVSDNAEGNSVIVGAAKVGGKISGGDSQNADSVGNSVTINEGAELGGAVYGGFADGTASGNTVNLLGGTYDSGVEIYGGFGQDGDAVGNTVNIAGGFAADAFAGVSLFGGWSDGSGAETGNTLNFAPGLAAGTEIQHIENFDTINIAELPASMGAGDALIKNGASSVLTGTTVNVGGINHASSLNTGDTLTLFENGSEDATYDFTELLKGMSQVYEVTIDPVTGVMTLGAANVNTSARYLSLGRLSAAAFADRGGDLVADSAYAAALSSFANPGEELCKGNFSVFAATSGMFGSHEYGNGGSVDIDGVNFLAGLGYRSSGVDSGWMLAAFFEGGFGEYKDGANAEGDTDYLGGGLMARIGAGSGFYAEGSVRAGRLTSDFRSGAIRDVNTNAPASYDDLRSGYLGAHAAIGYVFDAGSSMFDFSAKYLWTRSESESVVVLDENVEFDAISSRRVRLGGRWSYNGGGFVNPYAGAAFEHQFDGKAGTRVSGRRVADNELEGSSGIVDAGLRFGAASGSVTANVGAYAAFGAREDFGLKAFLGINF